VDVERQYVKNNTKSRERLATLVKNLTDAELKLVVYREGWTIAVILGHLAFWDERRLALAKMWRQGKLTPSNIDGVDMDTVNDALGHIFLTMPPRKLAELAISAAEKLDKELAGLPSEIIPAIEAMGDRHALNRADHRKMHLDEIETFLKGKIPNR
jgi:hypothetical protein